MTFYGTYSHLLTVFTQSNSLRFRQMADYLFVFSNVHSLTVSISYKGIWFRAYKSNFNHENSFTLGGSFATLCLCVNLIKSYDNLKLYHGILLIILSEVFIIS